ncbi:unnamed protein product [Heterobilharzia americana]|nr:unnamed protein product [Heterobilharzia americana]
MISDRSMETIFNSCVQKLAPEKLPIFSWNTKKVIKSFVIHFQVAEILIHLKLSRDIGFVGQDKPYTCRARLVFCIIQSLFGFCNWLKEIDVGSITTHSNGE